MLQRFTCQLRQLLIGERLIFLEIILYFLLLLINFSSLIFNKIALSVQTPLLNGTIIKHNYEYVVKNYN